MKPTPSFSRRPSMAEQVTALVMTGLLGLYDLSAPVLYFGWFSDRLNGILWVVMLLFTVPLTVVTGLLAYASCTKHLTLRDGTLTYRKAFKKPVTVDMAQVARVEVWLHWGSVPVVFLDLYGNELLRVYGDATLPAWKPFRRALKQLNIPFVEKEAK